ncbi:hypothetical protein V8G54_003929 [Vigna mungo]|uniref:Uncharacterized protein n=1 Tax=Vigna mungo TaxID=3915 RepID=A0AAQ3PF02_VIGMU
MRKAINHVLVLQYYEMDFDADLCDPEIDFIVFDHMHDELVEVVDTTPCFNNSNITNLTFFIDRVHIHTSSVFDDFIDLNALLDDEFDARDDSYVVFYDVRIDMADFENSCTDLGLEFEQISSAICSASNCFAGVETKIDSKEQETPLMGGFVDPRVI